MKIVTLDSRRRVSLAKVGNPMHLFYDCTTRPDGTIVMVPVVFVPLGEDTT